MKIVVTSQGPDLDSSVDPRFGRGRYFLLVDTESGAFTVHDNAQNLNWPQGAGVQAAQAVANLGPEALLTGNVGPKAFAALRAGNVAVYTGQSGSVREAVEQFKAGRFQPTTKANVEGHWA